MILRRIVCVLVWLVVVFIMLLIWESWLYLVEGRGVFWRWILFRELIGVGMLNGGLGRYKECGFCFDEEGFELSWW